MKSFGFSFLFAVVGVVVAGPVTPDRRNPYDWYPWTGTGAYAGPAGAIAGSGFMPFPFPMPTDYMVPFPFPMIPVPTFRFPQPWYKGPNVCVDTKYYAEPEDVKQLLSDPAFQPSDFQHESESCRGNNEVYICTGKTMTNEGSKMYATKYKCCHGFVRPFDGRSGCVESTSPDPNTPDPNSLQQSSFSSSSSSSSTRYGFVPLADLKDLIPALRVLKAANFVKMIENVGFVDRFHNENFTVFSPPDQSLEDFVNSRAEDLENEIPRLRGTEDEKAPSKADKAILKTLTSHMVKGFLRLDELEDEHVVQTEFSSASIRLSVYNVPYKVMMANCVPISTYNNYARNGIIHMLERVLPITTRTVADIIASDPQFSILKRLLSEAGLVQVLRNVKGNFTVFAPTDFSFQADEKLLEIFLNGSACVDNLLKNHIVDSVICSSALTNEAQVVNLLGDYLFLTRQLDGKIYVDDVQVVVKDIVGTNGVVHIIDGLLVPRQAKTISQVLEETGVTQFLQMVKTAGLDSDFDEMKNITFFIPSNVAVRKIPHSEMQTILSANESLNSLLLNHVISSEVMIGDMEHGLQLQPVNGNRSVPVKVYRSYPYVTKFVTIQCAKILSPDNRLCGSILHVVDRVLWPTKGTVLVTLESKPELSIFVELLRFTGLDARLREDKETFTVLAPFNDVFHRLPTHIIGNLRRDRQHAMNFLKMYILPESYCCDHLAQNIMSGLPQVRSVDGSLLRIFSFPPGVLRIGEAKIVDCDNVADNGVVHVVDNVLYSERTPLGQGTYFDRVLTFR